MAPPFQYVYLLMSKKDGKFYVGMTRDLKSRLTKHNNGEVQSTKYRLPVELIFYEAFANRYDAIRRENYLKSTKDKQTLRNMLAEHLSLLRAM